MDTLSQILWVALGFGILYMLFILYKFATGCCDAPENEKELLKRLREESVYLYNSSTSKASVEDEVDHKKGKGKKNLEQRYTPSPSSIMRAEKPEPDVQTNKIMQPRPKPKPLSPVESVIVVSEEEPRRNKVAGPNNFELLRQHGGRITSTRSVGQGSIVTQDHRPYFDSGATVELNDSEFGKMYPSSSFQTLDEFPDSLSIRGRCLDQLDTLAADSSLVIGTAASNGKIVGYCVNLVRRKCSFYSYETRQISLKSFFSSDLKLQQQQPEVLAVENLYFAFLLWLRKIKKYQRFRLHSNNHIDSSENQSMRQCNHFLDHLLNPNEHLDKVNSKYYVGSSSIYYNSYGLPATYLLSKDYSRFQAIVNDKFQVENIKGTHEIQATDGAGIDDTTEKYNEYLQKVESSMSKTICDCNPDSASLPT